MRSQKYVDKSCISKTCTLLSLSAILNDAQVLDRLAYFQRGAMASKVGALTTNE